MDPIIDTDVYVDQQTTIIYPNVWRRIVAYAIDMAILFALLMAMLEIRVRFFAVAALVSLILFLPVFEYLVRATPGKLVLRLEVRNSKLGLASVGEVLLRNSIGLCLVLLVILYLFVKMVMVNYFNFDLLPEEQMGDIEIAVILTVTAMKLILQGVTMMTNPRKQSIHDRVAGTVVIRRKGIFAQV